MGMSARRGGLVVLLLLLPIGGVTACAPNDPETATEEDDFTKSDFPADKCSTMVSIGAAIVGGEVKFVKLLDSIAKKREGRR